MAGGTALNFRSQKSLFGGLEEFDSSVDESFSLKSNAKRLVIKPKISSSSDSSQIAANRSIQLTESPGVRSSLPLADSSRQASTLPDSDTPRRVSWLHSNLEKVAEQNRKTDAAANNTIQELVSTKSKADATESNRRGQRDEERPKSAQFANDNLLSSKSFVDETHDDLPSIENDPHPTGITLTRPGYYTIPPLDKLVDYIREDGSCVVPDFTIGRKGYGNVYFGGPLDVAGLNLDDLVHFRHKEVVVYPDDENKPPVGTGLNRKAQITLDQVWPHDKTLHEPIKDRERLEAMDFEGKKLRAACDKNDTRFVEYRPETGSWVFKVDHFSKYGLDDSDDEDDSATEAKKAKTTVKDIRSGTLPAQGAIPKVRLFQIRIFMWSFGSDCKSLVLQKIISRPMEVSSAKPVREHGLGGVAPEIENGRYFGE